MVNTWAFRPLHLCVHVHTPPRYPVDCPCALKRARSSGQSPVHSCGTSVAIIEDMDDAGFGMAGDASDSDVGDASRAGHPADVSSFAAPAAMSAAQELQTRAVFHELLAHVRGMRRRWLHGASRCGGRPTCVLLAPNVINTTLPHPINAPLTFALSK
jgi:hypothetical protein